MEPRESEAAATVTPAESVLPRVVTARVAAASRTADDREERWQNRLLPLMISMIVGLTLFFFIASLAQLAYLHGKIWDAPRVNSTALQVPTGTGSLDEAARFNALAILEANAVERRYHQANVLLMSRVWARYLGFVTGMIMALVGATFILGKLREEMTSLEAKGSAAALTLHTASPGLVLAVLGVGLMAATIVTHQEISTTDTSIYMQLAAPSNKPPLQLADSSATLQSAGRPPIP